MVKSDGWQATAEEERLDRPVSWRGDEFKAFLEAEQKTHAEDVVTDARAW